MEDTIAPPTDVPLVLHQCNSTPAKKSYPISSQSIQDFPVELLVQIFQLCLPPDLRGRPPVSTEAPLLFCQICSRWREIALETPQLWTSLSIMIRTGESVIANFRKYEETANHWFQRAGNEPLSLGIDDTAFQNTGSLQNPSLYCNRLVALVLLPHINQIRELHLTFKDFSKVPLLSQLAMWSNYDHLESISLALRSEAPLPIFMFQFAPRLRKVKLLMRVDNGSFYTSLPWDRLTVLYIDDVTDDILHLLLSFCINLEDGTFSVFEPDPAPPPPPVADNDMVLPKLTKLTFIFPYHQLGDFFLRGYQFPALTWLSIVKPRHHTFRWDIPEHLYRQLDGIRRLTFGGLVQTPQIIDLLRHGNNITRFKVDLKDDHITLFRALTIRDGSKHLLPNLEDLYVHFSRRNCALPTDLAAFIDMLLSRTAQRVPTYFPSLRRVKVSVPFGTPDTVRYYVESVIQSLLPFGAPKLVFKVKPYDNGKEAEEDRSPSTPEGWDQNIGDFVS